MPDQQRPKLQPVPGRRESQTTSPLKIFDERFKSPTNPTPRGDSSLFSWAMFGELAIEFAVLIAGPLLLFLFLGEILNVLGLHSASEYINHQRHNNKAYMTIGLLATVGISFYAIIKKIREVERMINKK